jgi:hypothetical protein
VVPPWAGGRSSQPVTRAVAACAECEAPITSAAAPASDEEGGAR